jgi:hypothetical protein
MNDFQNTDMRALLSHAAPDPGEEPPARDVVGPAMAWGDRRRRLDRIMVGTGAALAVVAIGAGVTGLGGGNSSPRSTNAAAGTPTASSSSASSGCWVVAPGRLASPEFCAASAELSNFNHDFTQAAYPLLSGKLPAGVTATNTGAFYIKLSKGGTTEYLYPSITFRSTLDGGKEQCANPDCTLQPLLSGTAALAAHPGTTLVDWVADAGEGPRVTFIVTNSEPATYPAYAGDPLPGGNGLATPPGVPANGTKGQPSATESASATQPVKLMTKQQIADLIADPGFQQYATEQFAKLKDLNQKYQALLAKERPSSPGQSGSSSAAGSVPSSPDPARGATSQSGGTDPAKAPGTPISTLSGMPLTGATSHG